MTLGEEMCGNWDAHEPHEWTTMDHGKYWCRGITLQDLKWREEDEDHDERNM